MKKPLDCQSIQEFLVSELSRRKLKNESYSLRAFARDLDLSPSRLSEVMKGEAGLSEKSADMIADRLNMKARDRQQWKELVLASSARDPAVRSLAQKRINEMRKVDSKTRVPEEQFRVIADWYHAAIMELTLVEGFCSTATWIAKRLGISETEAKLGIERLISLGLLEKSEDGQLHAKPEAFSAFSDKTPSQAIRRFHRQMLSMAIESILSDSIEDREHVSTILAIPKSRMHEFRDEMNKFITQFWNRIEQDPKDELYALSLQLFPVRDRRRSDPT